MPGPLDRAFWEEHHRHGDAHAATSPNPHLVAAAAELLPGTALDAGCGQGADALWLAGRGWRVTAVDIAGSALEHARHRAASVDADTAGRVRWIEADITTWVPAQAPFDLVTAHQVHTEGTPEALVARLAPAVAPGGTLLFVSHDPSDPQTAHIAAPGVHVTAEDLAAGLDPGLWDIIIAETRSRPAGGHGGHQTTIRDAVLCARRR